MDTDRFRAQVRGCLLGGAIGDALGAPVEFWTLDRIRSHVGEGGVREYLEADFGTARGYGLVTDDTQMTLFTVEGIIRGRVREDRGLGFTIGVVDHAYRRWLQTQTLPGPPEHPDGWLAGQSWLYSRRAPGNTCLSALQQSLAEPYGARARNDSKGCGGVMRSAPFGLVRAPHVESDWVYDLACQAAGFTHGHPTGQVSSGALAFLVHRLVAGEGLVGAVDTLIRHLQVRDPDGETGIAVGRARALAGEDGPSARAVESLGAGWVAEEALAIAVYCALSYPGPEQVLDALSLAVTHSGDSDSTGSICGNILGTLHGDAALPAALVFEVEGRGTILELADDLVLESTSADQLHGDYGPLTRWTRRYPGG
jgi:ADP-ribosylglycohydrolase